MASESAIPVPASKWGDTEKIALLVSVIKATGSTKIKWADVAVPAGRTTQSSAKMYAELMKASATVTMTGGADITPSKKRGRKNDDNGAATPKKRVRKPKTADRVATSSPVDDDEEESQSKKVKVEAQEEDENDDFLNGESEAA